MANVIINLFGRRWKYLRPRRCVLKGEDCDGICDWHKHELRVRRDLKGLREMDTDLHELRHASSDFLDEIFVDKESSVIAAAMWKLGYRKLTKQQRKTLGID